MASDTDAPTASSWLVLLGLPGVIYAVGGAMISAGQSFFWIGVGLCILSWLLFIGDWFRVSRGMSNITKLSGTIIPNALLILVLWLAFRCAPLEISFETPNLEYSAGSDVHGMTWISAYSESKVTLENRTDSEYDNLDIFVRTNISIAQIAIVGDHINCTSAPDERFEAVIVGTNAAGGKVVMPLTPANIGPSYAPIYRITCDKIIGRSSVMLDLALINLNPTVNGRMPKEIVAPRTNPTWILIDVSYDGLGRRGHKVLPHCFKLACGPVPKEIQITH